MKNIKFYGLLLFAMLLWGLNVIAIKLLVQYFSPIMMSSIRILIAGLSVMLFLCAVKKLQLPAKKQWKWIVVASFLGIVLHHWFLSKGLARTSAANASIILGLNPLLTAVLAIIFGYSKMNMLSFFGFILGTIGIVLGVWKTGQEAFSFSVGDLYIFIAILAQASSFLVIRTITKTLPSLVLTGYMLLIGAVFLIAATLMTNPKSYSELLHAPMNMYVLLFASAVLATAIGQMIYNFSIAKIGPAETTIFTNFSTIFSLLASALLLKEAITTTQIIGCIAIIFGVLIGTGALEELIKKRRYKVLS